MFSRRSKGHWFGYLFLIIFFQCSRKSIRLYRHLFPPLFWEDIWSVKKGETVFGASAYLTPINHHARLKIRRNRGEGRVSELDGWSRRGLTAGAKEQEQEAAAVAAAGGNTRWYFNPENNGLLACTWTMQELVANRQLIKSQWPGKK